MEHLVREQLFLPAGPYRFIGRLFSLPRQQEIDAKFAAADCLGIDLNPNHAGGLFMLVVMHSHATEEQVRAVCQRIEGLGLKAHPMPGANRTAIGITGNKDAVDLGVLESLPGVSECIPVSKPYKLVSREAKEDDTVLRIPTPSGDVLMGGQHVALVAGPCAVETEAQCLAIAERVKQSGARLFRGGAY